MQNEAGAIQPGASPIPPGLAENPTQQDRVAGTGRGYVRLAVMDGKTITHRVCFLC